MTTPAKKGTVAEAMAAANELHQQVVENREKLDARMTEFEKDIRYTLDQWTRGNKRDKETLTADFEELRTAVAKKHSELSGRVDEIGMMIAAFKQTVDSSRETTLEIKKTVDSLQDSLTPPSVPEPVVPATTHVPVTFGESWRAFQKSPWYPWARFVFWIAVGILVYHFVFTPFSTRSVGPNLFPNIIRPDVNTPVGAATVEVSQPPFRNDHVSRAAFGRIFDALDEYVRSGQISDFEGYYNEFGRRMQESIDAGKYEQWAGFWNRLATVCHRYGGGANDLQAFNNNLQNAAKVVAVARDGYSQPAGGNGLHPGGMFPGHATATYGDVPGSAGSAARPMVPLQPATDVPNPEK